jgi:aminoglycoside phosphotransferase (APT) family kinase protein
MRTCGPPASGRDSSRSLIGARIVPYPGVLRAQIGGRGVTGETFAGGIPPEVAPVRPGEQLDWACLADHLATHLDVTGELAVMQFPNGSANLTYLLTFTTPEGDAQRFVLRRPPFGVVAPGAHDMKREHRVLSRLWRCYDRAPRAYLFCDDPSVVGADFVVSEYRRGEVVWAELPPSMAGLPDAGRRVGDATVDALADLHLVDPTACDLADLGRPDGYVDRQLRGWRDRWQRVASAEHDVAMTSVGDRLAASVPDSPPPTLLHNDFKTDNCQFRPGEPDRVTAVFDWDMATLGDPLMDVGTLLNYWPDPSDTADDRAFHIAGMEGLGFPSRSEAVARYATRTGIDVGGIAWYEAFACWRTCVILQQLHQRFVRGESSDERMASRGDHIAMLVRRAGRLLDESPAT